MVGHKRIAIVVGSTRPTRICVNVATWVRNNLPADSILSFELLDLAAIDLPFLDEPLKPALHQYAHEHTKRWSHVVTGFDGFIFVFPQYNWGYPGVLKNAVDYLYDEWRNKPATVVTYGTRGGGKAAAQFTEVMKGVHIQPLATRLEAVITDNDVDDNWQLVDAAKTLKPALKLLKTIDSELSDALTDTQ